METEVLRPISELLEAANNGDTEAMYELSHAYVGGEQVEEDYDKSIFYLKKSAEGRNPAAMFEYGLHLLDEDDNEGLNYLIESARCGITEAFFQIGDRYEETGNIELARDYYTQGSEQGCGDCRLRLLRLSPLMDNPVIRFTYDRFVKNGGSDEEAVLLGYIYDSQYGSPTRKAFANNFLNEHQLGISFDQDTKADYAYLYLTGEKVDQDIEYGLDALESIANDGGSLAMVYLANIYRTDDYVPADLNKSLHYLEKAAAAGNLDALVDLGSVYKDGLGVKQDLQKTIECWTKAAQGGNPRSQYNLGIAYTDGLGVVPDLNKAKFWLEKSSAQNYERAIDALKDVNEEIASAQPKANPVIEKKSGCAGFILVLLSLSAFLSIFFS